MRVTSRQQAVQMAAAAMRDIGHPDAHEAPAGGAVDVRATRALGQVDLGPAQTSRADLQRLVGARGYETYVQLFFFTAGGFSDQALEYAQHMDIAAFTFDADGRLTPRSPASRRARVGPPARPAPSPPVARRPWWKRAGRS